MNTNESNAQRTLRTRLKDQAVLFQKISELDGEERSLDEFLIDAVDRISRYWSSFQNIPVSIEYENNARRSKNFSDDSPCISARVDVGEGNEVVIRILKQKESDFRDEEQALLQAITSGVGSKVKQIIARDDVKKILQLLDKAYKLAQIGTWEYDMQNDKLEWSSMTKEVHGFDDDYEPDVEATINLFQEGYHRDTFAKAAYEAIKEEKPFDVELKIISGKGDERWIHATGEPEFQNGVCTRFYGISQNVTGRKQAEEDLQLSERRFKALVQDGSDMIVILDEEANYTYVSPSSESVLGIPAKSFIGKNAFDFIHKADKARIFEQFTTLAPKERLQIKPFRFRNGDGDWRWIETTVTNLMDDPAVGGFVAISRDVTERKLQQEQIVESLKEKETLLSEIHHRVKNNLAVISGLLQLQVLNEKNEKALSSLKDSIARVHTIASIHEQLYQSHSFSRLDLSERIRQLIITIKKTFQTETDVRLNFRCDSIYINIIKALPFSLIVNEIITNIFKHAFRGKAEGRIGITLKNMDETGEIFLSITDDGVGLPEGFKGSEDSSLGLTLIHLFSQQLKGEYGYDSSENGTTFTLRFKKDEDL